MLSLTDLLARIGSGASTADEAVALAHRRIAERDGEVGAFVHVDRDARAAGRGPLNGIAVGVKDIIDTADMPTAMGSAIYAGWRPRADAPVVSALKRAGATVIGKATTTPFAYIDPTATRNPRDLAHTPGGSSAGSAAAVAAGMVPLAIGTQTGGSVIRPASFCGVAAIKPSFRLIPTVGVKCFSWTLDTVGLFAAGVADLASALEYLTGRPMPDGRVSAPRIGLVLQDFAGPREPDAEQALEQAAAALSAAGAQVRTLSAPDILAEAWAAHPTIQDFEVRAALAWEYDHHRAALPPLIGGLLDRAQSRSAGEYDSARRIGNSARSAAKALFAEVDALVTFSAPGAAPHGLGSTGEARFNRLWTLLGSACVNVPGLANRAGLPVGIQVVAPFARDALALDVARFAERALEAAHER